MIVVIGSPAYLPGEEGRDAAYGTAAAIARAAAGDGAAVELLGRIGDDGAGDALVLALARDHVGHAALLRDAAHPTPLAALDDEVDDAASPGLALVEGRARTGGHDGLLPADAAARPAIDAGDIELGLRYLTDFRVLVVAQALDGPAGAAVRDAAAFCSAHVVLVLPPGDTPPVELQGATVLEAPIDDPDGRFAGLVGRYAAELDGGRAPSDAFRAGLAEAGWERSMPELSD